MATSWPITTPHARTDGIGLDITSWNPNPGYESLVLQVQSATFTRKMVFHTIVSLILINVIAFMRPSLLCQRYRNTGFVLYEYSPTRILVILVIGIVASWNTFEYIM